QYFKANATARLGADHVTEYGHRSGSTDMGDLSHVMPSLHPYMGGASGSGHGADYMISDPRLAYLETAKQLALMAIDLLWDDAGGAREILKGFRPRMTKDEYLSFQRGVARAEVFDGA
ncbi:MAG TPA: amidohydrolase, partial [Methylomirabilota bacterium]|nr:amidohydrolase [Methylomirabilota bacterium]